MAQRDIDKLLGGYATGTLTDEERRRLFEAALHDQAVFEALTREDALKEVLDDPRHRRRLLEALEARQQASRRPFGNLLEWFRRPANLALAGTLATAVVAAWVFFALERQGIEAPVSEDQVAQLEEGAQEPTPRREPVARKDALESTGGGAASTPSGRAGGPQAKPEAPKRSAVPSQPVGPEQNVPAAALSKALPADERKSQPLWLAAYRRPVESGPARTLYYGRLSPEPRREAGEKAAKQRAPGEGRRSFESLASVAEEMAGVERGQLGLRYSVLKRNDEGDFGETNPDGPFEVDDALRVTVEVNEAGYLYAFRLGPRGRWRWISPSGLLGQEERGAGVAVLGGKRYLIPGTGVLPLYGRPAANKIILIYSRQPRQELQVFHPAARERQERDGRPSADLESLLNRARVETSALPLFVEEVGPDQPDGLEERAVYIVNSEAGEDAAIVVELTFPSA